MPTAVKTLHAFASHRNMYHEWFVVPCLERGRAFTSPVFPGKDTRKLSRKYFGSLINSSFALGLTRAKVRSSLKHQLNHRLFSLILERATSKFAGLELSAITW